MKTKFLQRVLWLMIPLLTIFTTNAWGAANSVTINANQITGFGSGSQYGSGSITIGDITIASNSGFSTTQFRVAKSKTMTISTSVGKITKIVVNCSSNYKFNDNTNLSYSGTAGTYTNAAGVTSITFTNSKANIARITSIVITYGYLVTYDKNGGTGTATDSDSPYAKNATVTTKAANTFTAPDGKTFAGWNTDANGSGTSYVAGATFKITANTTLYAQWEAAAPAYSVTWTINPAAGGTLSTTSGTSTTVTPDDAYTYGDPAYTVTTGSATVSQSTNTFTATPTSDCTIRINMVEKPKFTVTLKDDNSTLTQVSYGASVTLPSRAGCAGYTFAGWTKTWVAPQSSWTSTAPAIINAGNYTPTGNENLYPVYTKVESGGTPETVTLYDEPFTGSAHSTGVESTNVAATTDMFVDGSATVWSHYSFDAASTAAYANNYGGETISDGIKIKREANNTTVTMMEVTGIKISGASDLELSLCNRRTAASATLNISYKIDDGSYTAVGGTISYNSTNDTWKKCTGLTISGTGTSLDLKIELIVSGTTNRTMVLDDIKITGETGGSTTYYISVPSCCENIVPAPVVTGTSTKNTITLSWDNVTGANGYTVTCSGGTPGEVTSSGTSRSCEITGLSPNTAYTWTVVATYTSPYCQATAANGSTTTQQVYTVSYNKNGGSSVTVSPLPASANYAAGEPVTVAAKPNTTTNAGYAFTGWNTQQDGAGTHYDADGTKTFVMPANAVVLYAEWTKKKNYYVDRMHGTNDGHTVTIDDVVYNCYLREGANYTVPTISDNTSGASACHSEHDHLLFWVTASSVNADGTLTNSYTEVTPGDTKTATTDGTVYYAIWGKLAD